MNTKVGIIALVTLSSLIYVIHRKYENKKRIKKYTEFMNMNVKELRAMCYIRDIQNPNKLRKHEMIDLLLNFDNA